MKYFEIEQKFKIKTPHLYRRRLTRLGARKIRAGRQYNEYLDKKGTLKSHRMILRLRKDASGSYLTLKGSRLPGTFTQRREYESPVCFDAMKALLEVLGFKMFRKYTKYREEFQLRQSKVALDRLQGHGWFLEIEGTLQSIRALSKKLDLNEGHREERSYLAILFPELIVYDRP